MADGLKRRLSLWGDEPEVRAGARTWAAPVFETAEGEDGLTVLGATGVGEALEVPEAIGGRPVVAVGPSAFQGSPALRRVTLPEGLRRVERCAFQGCAALESVKLPRRMERVGESAFQGCAALDLPSLPEGLTEIADRTFYGCASLRRADIPRGVGRVGERAFAGCKALARVALPEGLRAVGHRAFADCPALKALEIPASVTELSASALPRGLLGDGEYWLRPQAMLVRAEAKRRYALPRGTRSLAGGALSGNDALLEVDFGDALERVGPYALADCVCLKRVSLPPTVRALGRGAFSGCARLREAVLSPALAALPDEAFLDCGALERVALFPGVASVGEQAFADCRSLRALALPEGVRSVGSRAFYRCASLERLELPATLRALGAGALSGCAGLRTLVLGSVCDGEMLSVLADARTAAILSPCQPPEAFPGPWRKRVCLGFVQALREGVVYRSEVARACVEWMRRHGDAFVAEALEDVGLMRLLAEEGCLSKGAVQALLERAQGPDRDEYYVTLLEYRNRRFPDEAPEVMKLW